MTGYWPDCKLCLWSGTRRYMYILYSLLHPFVQSWYDVNTGTLVFCVFSYVFLVQVWGDKNAFTSVSSSGVRWYHCLYMCFRLGCFFSVSRSGLKCCQCWYACFRFRCKVMPKLVHVGFSLQVFSLTCLWLSCELMHMFLVQVWGDVNAVPRVSCCLFNVESIHLLLQG